MHYITRIALFGRLDAALSRCRVFIVVDVVQNFAVVSSRKNEKQKGRSPEVWCNANHGLHLYHIVPTALDRSRDQVSCTNQSILQYSRNIRLSYTSNVSIRFASIDEALTRAENNILIPAQQMPPARRNGPAQRL